MPTDQKQSAVIALGMFDGVHLGHRALLACAVETAKSLNCKSVAYTFSNHPRSLFARPPKLLTTPGERRERLLSTGVDIVSMEVFDRTTASLSPRAFVEELLREYAVRAIVVGFNYAFGQGGQGGARTLQVFGKEYGFDVHVIEPVAFEGETVSSSRIRELLETGNLHTANAMLCTPYVLCGKVSANRGIGKSLGFPTANILPPAEKVQPKPGVYITTVLYQGMRYAAVTNVGDNPTVSGKFVTVETHILDFHGDLYGQEICVEFRVRLRDEVRFPGKSELAQQIEIDTTRARAWLREAQLRELG